MFYGNNIEQIRSLYLTSWKKYKSKQTLSQLERQIVTVILEHPEYQAFLDKLQIEGACAYNPAFQESNPFLHMGLHLAIRDQISTDKPKGITALYNKLLIKHGDTLVVEHLFMDALYEVLSQAQAQHKPPNEQDYLQLCSRLLLNIC